MLNTPPTANKGVRMAMRKSASRLRGSTLNFIVRILGGGSPCINALRSARKGYFWADLGAGCQRDAVCIRRGRILGRFKRGGVATGQECVGTVGKRNHEGKGRSSNHR